MFNRKERLYRKRLKFVEKLKQLGWVGVLSGAHNELAKRPLQIITLYEESENPKSIKVKYSGQLTKDVIEDFEKTGLLEYLKKVSD